MRIWVQVFSSRDRNPDFHAALEEHLRSVVEPDVEIEVHGTRKGGLDVVESTPAQFAAFRTRDLATWARMIKERNIRAE
jgi:hypothetical protein